MPTILPGSCTLNEIRKASMELQHRLTQLDLESLPVSSGVKSYYRYDLSKLTYVSECNAYLLYHILRNNTKNLNDILIIDHGAGIGIFSFLVKYVGLQCLSHDISSDYLQGIKIIGDALQLTPDHFVLGDTMELVNYCKTRQLNPDGLGSRNVIEHLPDYSEFFKWIGDLSNPGFTAMITTSANPHNPLVKRIHLKIHHQYETIGSNMDMDNPEVNAQNCGLKLRTAIIQNRFPELDESQRMQLAKRTRGYTEKEILLRVKRYIESGILPPAHPHPSNTCDPFTGAWVERLVDYRDYQKAAEQYNFVFQCIPGFYNTHYNSPLKNLVSRILNFILRIKNPWTVNISPFLAIKLIKN
jgi:hypothetical protein